MSLVFFLLVGQRPRLPSTRRGAFLREFAASELEVVGFAGSVGVMEVAETASPNNPLSGRRKEPTSTRVRVFLARVNDPAARSRGEDTRVSLREYSSLAVMRQEMAAHARITSSEAVVELLGTLDARAFVEDDRFIEAWVANLKVDPPAPESGWLVFRWAGTLNAQSLSELEPNISREIMRQALEAVASLHDQGLAHRSLGPSALVFDSKQQDKTRVEMALLRVRLDFLAFATPATLDAIADDLKALGYVFLGIGGFTTQDQDTLKRLYEDIFDGDVARFREYALDDPNLASAVDFFDQDDGWDLIDRMLRAGNRAAAQTPQLTLLTARGLLASPFFTNKKQPRFLLGWPPKNLFGG